MPRLMALLIVIPLSACGNPTGLPRLVYEARSTVSPAQPMTVETTVTVRNTGNAEALLEANTCGHPIMAFETPTRMGREVWRSVDPLTVICNEDLKLVSLVPGDYYDFHFTGTIPSSLPPGTYYLAVDMPQRVVPAGQFEK